MVTLTFVAHDAGPCQPRGGYGVPVHRGESGGGADTVVYKEYEDFITKNFPPDFFASVEELATRVQDGILGPGYYESLMKL